MPSIALSPFQKEKLEFFFNFYEPNENGYLDHSSLDRFMKRVLDFTHWDPNGAKARECEEVHEAFFEILLEKAKGGNKGQINKDQWLDMWAGLLPGCMGIGNFPIWLRLLPKLIFQMIDRNNDLHVGPNELVAFYRDMVRIPKDVAEKRGLYAYEQMTDQGRHPLDINSYEMIFSNFLIGRTPYGPGRHIFGCFEHASKPFKLIQMADDEEEDQVGTRKPEHPNPIHHYEKPKPFRQASSSMILPKKF